MNSRYIVEKIFTHG